MAIFICFAHSPGISQDLPNCGSEKNDNLVFIINSIEPLKNGPTVDTTFELERPRTITLIRTCHWNYGRGQPFSNKAIRILGLDNGFDMAYPITYGETRDGVSNVYWVASGNSETQGCNEYASLNVPLERGRYQIIDPDPQTWSYNSDTKGRGITFIYALP